MLAIKKIKVPTCETSQDEIHYFFYLPTEALEFHGSSFSFPATYFSFPRVLLDFRENENEIAEKNLTRVNQT